MDTGVSEELNTFLQVTNFQATNIVFSLWQNFIHSNLLSEYLLLLIYVLFKKENLPKTNIN